MLIKLINTDFPSMIFETKDGTPVYDHMCNWSPNYNDDQIQEIYNRDWFEVNATTRKHTTPSGVIIDVLVIDQN